MSGAKASMFGAAARQIGSAFQFGPPEGPTSPFSSLNASPSAAVTDIGSGFSA